MIDVSKKIIGLLILVFLAFNLISCQQNGPAVLPSPETLSDREATAIVGQQAVAETPSAIPSPISQVITVPSPSRPVLAQESSDPGQWQRLDTTGGGGQTSIAAHPTNPNIVYLASDNGGLFKTENGGDSWFSVSSNLGAYRLGFVTLDSLDPDIIYVTASTDYGAITEGGATGEIYRSLDGGLTWEFVSDAMGFQNSFPNQRSIVIPYDPANPSRFDQDGDSLSDMILVGAWTGPANPSVGGIWRSKDEGETFTHLALEDRNVTALRAFPGDVQVLYATTYEGEVYRSEDMGEQWVEITGNMPLKHVSDIAAHPTDKNILYVTCRWCQAGEEPVWKTVDGGQSWQASGARLDTKEIEGFPKLLIDRFDPETLYVITWKATYGQGGVYQSTDGGSSWSLMPIRLVLPDGRPYFWPEFDEVLTLEQAIDGRLFASDSRAGWRYPAGDGQAEWEPATIGIGNIHVHSIAVNPLNPSELYQGIADLGPYKSIDGGESFHRVLGTGWPVELRNYKWSGPYYRNYEECSLSCSATCTGDSLGSGGTTDFVISHQDPNIVYSAFGSGSGSSIKGGVNKSTDGGATWQPVGFQMENGFTLNPDGCVPYGFQHLAIDPTNDEIVFAAQDIPTNNSGKLYKTSDGGATWVEVHTVSQNITGIAVSALDPDVVIFTSKKNVYKSDQGGEAGSWQVITPPVAVGLIKAIALSPHDAEVYVIGTNDLGLYYTSDGGMSWSNNRLEGFFEQRLSEGSSEYVDAEIATAFNPEQYVLTNISAVAFDPVQPDTFYVGSTQYTRASFGIAKITNAGQDWERLPLNGLSHRNVFDLTVDPVGEYLYAGTFNGTYRLELR